MISFHVYTNLSESRYREEKRCLLCLHRVTQKTGPTGSKRSGVKYFAKYCSNTFKVVWWDVNDDLITNSLLNLSMKEL